MKTCLAFYFPAVEFFFKAQNWSKNPEMAKLEFENHGFLQNNIFLATEQAGTNICQMVYQDINVKICLSVSLFDWKENKVYKQHIHQDQNNFLKN